MQSLRLRKDWRRGLNLLEALFYTESNHPGRSSSLVAFLLSTTNDPDTWISYHAVVSSYCLTMPWFTHATTSGNGYIYEGEGLLVLTIHCPHFPYPLPPHSTRILYQPCRAESYAFFAMCRLCDLTPAFHSRPCTVALLAAYPASGPHARAQSAPKRETMLLCGIASRPGILSAFANCRKRT